MVVRHANSSCRVYRGSSIKVLADRVSALEAEIERLEEDNRQLRAAVAIYAELANQPVPQGAE